MSAFTEKELTYLAGQRLGRIATVRGTAEVLESGGKTFGEQMDDTLVRIRPTRIISFGIEPGQTQARSV